MSKRYKYKTKHPKLDKAWSDRFKKLMKEYYAKIQEKIQKDG